MSNATVASCEFKRLIKSPGFGELKSFEKREKTPCDDSDPIRVAYGGETEVCLCGTHAEIIKYYWKGPVANRAEILLEDVRGEPRNSKLTEEELEGHFELEKWSNDRLIYDRNFKTWRSAWLEAAHISSFGKGDVKRSDGPFSISYFQYGYIRSDVGGVMLACIYIPILRLQLEVPASEIEGDESIWQSKTLLHSIRASSGYVDGLNAQGISLWLQEPTISLAERVVSLEADLSENVSDDGREVYQPSPVRHGVKVPELKKTEASNVHAVKAVWEATKETIWGATEPIITQSPGKIPRWLPEGLPSQPVTSAYEELLKPGLGVGYKHCYPAGVMCSSCSRIVFDGAAACVCGVIPYPDMISARDISHTQTQRNSLSGGRIVSTTLEEYIAAFESARGNLYPPQGNSAGAGGGGGDDGDGSDGSTSSSTESLSAGDEAPMDAAPTRKWILDLVKRAHALVLKSTSYKRAKKLEFDKRQRAEDARLAATLAAQRTMLAVAMSRQQDFQALLAKADQAHKESMAKAAQISVDEAAIRKEDNGKFVPNAAKFLAVLGVPERGDAGNQTGDRHPVYPSVGFGLSLGKLFLAVTDAVTAPLTRGAFKCIMRSDMVHNLVSGNWGGAPSYEAKGGKGYGVLTYNGGASIRDYVTNPNPSHHQMGTVYKDKVVPSIKKMPIVSDDTRAKQSVGSIYELCEGWTNAGTVLAMVAGGAWGPVFARCGQQLKKLHEQDPQVYNRKLLWWLSDVAMCNWCQQVDMIVNGTYAPSRVLVDLSDSFGFLVPTPIPGDGFVSHLPWMQNNFALPFAEDVLAAARVNLSGLSDAEKIKQGISGLPHYDVSKDSTQVTMSKPPKVASGSVVLGYESDNDEFYEVEDHHYGDDDEEVGEVYVGGPKVKEERTGQKRTQPIVGVGARKSTINEGRAATGYSFNAPKRQDRQEDRGEGRLMRIPNNLAKEAFGTLPNTVDAHGKTCGAICLRYLCHGPLGPNGKQVCETNCTSDVNHPNRRAGEVCNRSHEQIQGTLTYLHAAMALTFGGLRGTERTPRDPLRANALKEKYVKAYKNGEKLDVSNIDSCKLGGEEDGNDWTLEELELAASEFDEYACGVEEDEGLGSEVTRDVTQKEYDEAYERKVKGVAKAQDEVILSRGWYRADGQWTTTPGVVWSDEISKISGSATRAGVLAIIQLGCVFTVYNLGSRLMRMAPGGATVTRMNSCVLLTLGKLLEPQGYDAHSYLREGVREFARKDIPPELISHYKNYAALLASSQKLPLHIVVHWGLPPHMAWVIVLRNPSEELKLIIFTDGKPKRVGFAHINNTHIMPMVLNGYPFGITWQEFQPMLKNWEAAGGMCTTVHTRRSLGDASQSNEKEFGSRPCGSEERGSEEIEEELRIELGMEDERENKKAEQRYEELEEKVKSELRSLCEIMHTHKGGAGPRSVGEFNMVTYLENCSEEVWKEHPILGTYYQTRRKLEKWYNQDCDKATEPFVDWVWRSAGSIERPFPFPGLYKGILAGVWELEIYAAGLFILLTQNRLYFKQAAALVVISVCEEEDVQEEGLRSLHEYPRKQDNVGLILSHLYCQQYSEWDNRYQQRWHLKQWRWARILLESYDLYLTEREASAPTGFFSDVSLNGDKAQENVRVRTAKYTRLFTKKVSVASIGRVRNKKSKRREGKGEEQETIVVQVRMSSKRIKPGFDFLQPGQEHITLWEQEGGARVTRTDSTATKASPSKMKVKLKRDERCKVNGAEKRNSPQGRREAADTAMKESTQESTREEASTTQEKQANQCSVCTLFFHIGRNWVSDKQLGVLVCPHCKQEAARQNETAAISWWQERKTPEGYHKLTPEEYTAMMEGNDDEAEKTEETARREDVGDLQEISENSEEPERNKGKHIVFEQRKDASIQEEHEVQPALHGLGVEVPCNRNSASAVAAEMIYLAGLSLQGRAELKDWMKEHDQKGQTEAQAASSKLAHETKVRKEAEVMMQTNSSTLRELQPWVKALKEATEKLHTAVVNEVTVGEEGRNKIQTRYLKAANALCKAVVERCNTRWWPQVFITAYRAGHPGRVHPDVDPEEVRKYFADKVHPDVLRNMVHQAEYGVELHMDRSTVTNWPAESPTAKKYKAELWRLLWTDAAYGGSYIFGPECNIHMDMARIEGYPLHRIPKKSTSTGKPTGKGRPVADLSHENQYGDSINASTLMEIYGTFELPRHADVARDVLIVRQWFPRCRIKMVKFDVVRAFRQKLVAAASFGICGCRISGHTFLDGSCVFGHAASPKFYAGSAQGIHEGHNASRMRLTPEETKECYAGFETLTEDEKEAGVEVPFVSQTYVDDGVVVVASITSYAEASMQSYQDCMEAAVGRGCISDKDPEEKVPSSHRIVMGLLMKLGEPQDEQGEEDFIAPTPERIQRMIVLMDNEQFTPQGKHTLTAGVCAQAFSMWLWMCICSVRLKAFIGSFKRVFEGKTQWSSGDIVTPVRAGDNPQLAWAMFWNDMTTLKSILKYHALMPNCFQIPIWRLLCEEEQLTLYGERFAWIGTDASMFGGGGVYYGKQDDSWAGQWFRVAFPSWVIRDIRECMARGHDVGGSTQYTIAIAEKAMHTLALNKFGQVGRCYAMLQDNDNVVRWVKKGWGKPLAIQEYLRQDFETAQKRSMWAAIEYIESARNKLPDLLSRSFTENGESIESVMAEFRDEIKKLGLTEVESKVSQQQLMELMPETVSSKYVHKWEGSCGSNEGTDEASEEADHQDSKEEVKWELQEPWESPQDADQDKSWHSLMLGGRQRKKGKEQAKSGEGLIMPLPRVKQENGVEEIVRKETTEEAGSEEVVRILNKRCHKKVGIQYKVRWKGWSNTSNRWIAEEDCACSKLIADFESRWLLKGPLEEGTTDAIAEVFYYGSVLYTKGAQAASVPEEPTSKIPKKIGAEAKTAGKVELDMDEAVKKKIGVSSNYVKKEVDNTPSYAGKHYWEKLPEEEKRSLRERSRRQDEERNARLGEVQERKQDIDSSQRRHQNSRSVFRDAGQTATSNLGKGTGKGSSSRGSNVQYEVASARENRSAGRGDARGNTTWNQFMGPSLSEKMKTASERTTGRREEVVIELHDMRLMEASAKALAFALSKNTRRTYGANFQFFLDFCARQNLSPFLDGVNKRQDETTLIAYVMYEWTVHGNKHATLKLKLSAIRSATMEDGHPNPLENKFSLSRHMTGIKILSGASNAKEPLPAEAFRNILAQTRNASLHVRAGAYGAVLAFFFLLRISEFAARDKYYMEDFIAQRRDISFYSEGQVCGWDHPKIDAIELFIRGSKTDQKKQGCRRMQQATGDVTFCPVVCMIEWFASTEGSHIPSNAPLFSIPKGRHGREWGVLTREVITMLVKGAAADCKVPPEWVGTHSIRISGATALLLAGVPPETVKIIGRWASNAFIGYTRYQAELMTGVSARMAGTHYVVRPSQVGATIRKGLE